jgi:hypothetical protein
MQISQRTFAPCANDCGGRLRPKYRKYCSNACRKAAHRKVVLNAFYAGTLEARPFFNKIVRAHLLEKFGNCCQRCGWCERNLASGNIPVEIEHIDGDWRNVAPENVTLLCPNCHSLTKTFRGLNRGNGRPGRPGTSASVRKPHDEARAQARSQLTLSTKVTERFVSRLFPE